MGSNGGAHEAFTPGDRAGPVVGFRLCAAAAGRADHPVVRVSGLSHINEPFVLAQLESAPGRPFSRAAADRDRVRLDRLGVFGEISLTASALDDGVQVDVTLTETLRILPTLASPSPMKMARPPGRPSSS